MPDMSTFMPGRQSGNRNDESYGKDRNPLETASKDFSKQGFSAMKGFMDKMGGPGTGFGQFGNFGQFGQFSPDNKGASSSRENGKDDE
jgi:hypothetical protein